MPTVYLAYGTTFSFWSHLEEKLSKSIILTIFHESNILFHFIYPPSLTLEMGHFVVFLLNWGHSLGFSLVNVETFPRLFVLLMSCHAALVLAPMLVEAGAGGGGGEGGITEA